MREELDNLLCTEFPNLFRTRHDPETRTGIAWGFECGDGWYDLIKECSAKIEAVNNRIEDPKLHITAAQVKEKFGGLRFYLNTCEAEVGEKVWEEIHGAIRVAEEKASKTCEECGEPGIHARIQGWVSTLCQKHMERK